MVLNQMWGSEPPRRVFWRVAPSKILIQQIQDEAKPYGFLKGSLGNCEAKPLVRRLTSALSCAHTCNPLFNLGSAKNKKLFT